MAIPSPVKIKKDGVEYVSQVDRVNYTIAELTRAALRDCGKLIVKRTKQRIHKRTGRLAKNIQYWVRKNEGDLQVGFKPGGFYGGFQELGTIKQPKISALSNSTQENIAEMQRIQAQYLSAIADEQSALALISEEEYMGGEES